MKKYSIHRLFRNDYPKLTILLLLIILAYFLFRNTAVQDYISELEALSYLGIFIAGIFFTFGFTTPFAVGFFIVASPENIFMAAIIGGFGAMIGDLFIFKFIRMNFMDEFLKLEHTKVMKELISLMKRELSHKVRVYLMYLFAGIIIASPMPDEAGMIMLAGLSHIKIRALALISIIFNTLGILIMLLI